GRHGIHNLRSRSRRGKAGAPSSFPDPCPKPDGRSAMRERAERGTVRQAAGILGLPERTVQDLAARGEIAGAAKFGRRWTFDFGKLRRLVRQKERQTWQSARHRADATGGLARYGGGLGFAGENSDGRFTRLTRRLRACATRRRESA